MNVLFIGDIFGSPGRTAVAKELENLKKSFNIDLTIANAENTTHGKSLSIKHFMQLKDYGIDFFTMGNHTWSHPEIYSILRSYPNIVRPLNVTGVYADHGSGSSLINHKGHKIRITNLIGRSIPKFETGPNPFIELDKIVELNDSDWHIVDIHAESTGEKNALALDFDGKVSAVLGTHTHVQTADERILAKGTAFITDVGMTGAHDGVIGADAQTIINKQRHDEPMRLKVGTGRYQLCAVILTFLKPHVCEKNTAGIYCRKNALSDN